jgi:flavin prenyltransferase
MNGTAQAPRRLIIGITGATGIVFGIRALEVLRELGVESHLVVSRAGEMTRAHETEVSREALHALADHVHPINDVGASIASGSFRTMGMLIAPCSVRTLGEVATGVTTTLLTRAADIVLKERRRLVMMVREAPLHAGHLRNMLAATEMGAIIHPPVPAFYTKPWTIADLVDHALGRALDCFGLDMPNMPRWGEEAPEMETGEDPGSAGHAHELNLYADRRSSSHFREMGVRHNDLV